jgi:hypothetical protein
MDKTISTSLIGLSGVILGVLITSINNLILKRKEAKLRIIEKIIDKRIIAHEEILGCIKKIRTVVGTEKTDEQRNLISYPIFMDSHNSLSELIRDLFPLIHKNTHWLNTPLERELSFLQDYFITLFNKTNGLSDQAMIDVGIIVKQDFIDQAASLENLAFDFFRKDIFKLALNKHDEWHKFPKAETNRRFAETNLVKRAEEITLILNQFIK